MFELNQIIPWGRSFDEYRRMFALTDDDMQKRVIGCGDGPAGFNAEATARGCRIVSCDPLYQFNAVQIRERINATHENVLEQTRRNRDAFVWREIRDVEELGQRRRAAMATFLDDYEAGKRAGRYIDAALPRLPFDDGAFDLALCSHLLFLYSDQLTECFHIDAVAEMYRGAREVRIFPLLALSGDRSRHLAAVCAGMRSACRVARIEPVSYEFQRGATEMLRIR